MRRWPFRTGSIAGKLYLTAALAVLAVSALAAASIYFSRLTETAARRLQTESLVGVMNATQLQLLLEQHRRIVESMPAEVDRTRLTRSRAQLDEIGQTLTTLINDLLLDRGEGAIDAMERSISDDFPILFRLGDSVAFYADNFAQDKADAFADQYASVARDTAQQIRSYRERRLDTAQTAVAHLQNTAKSLLIWVSVCTLVAFVLIGPVALLSMHGVLSRLGLMTEAMVKVARNEHSVPVPVLDDRDEVGEMARAVEVFRNNAQQLAARELQLAEVNQRLDVALNNMTHGLCMFDRDQRLIVCNRAYTGMYGLPPELAVAGTPLSQMWAYRSRVGTGALRESIEHVPALTPNESSAFTNDLMDGRTIAISRHGMPDGGWVAVHEDISERRRAEAEIIHLARHDLLTDLPNRVLFKQHLEQAFSAGGSFAVLYLDLDRFKQVNDTLGHPVGDELLIAVAGRLRSTIAAQDIVARIGGDEFAIVLRSASQEEQCGRLAERIIEEIAQPFVVAGKHIVIGTSVGIALAPVDGTDADQLMKSADMALYLAKSEGRGTHRFFVPELERRVQERRALELDLRSAITRGEFELYYQPIVDLKDNRIKGYEALLRWVHPERGHIAPLEFIPIAEETGLIIQLGEWVLRTACQQAARWSEPVKVAVNLSPAQFKGGNLVQSAKSALAASGLSPDRLELEITESVLLEDEPSTLAVLHQLRAIGIGILMDDFGTGYSSLAYLRSFPFDKIKIDRSFVHDMAERDDCRVIVHAVAALARSLNIKTVVEGVETKIQLDLARVAGCDEGQGYVFGAPVPEWAIPHSTAPPMRAVNAA